MSQSKSSKGPKNHFSGDCALLMDGHILGGATLDVVDSYIDTIIQIHREVDATSVMGFSISIPFGESNEDGGFGACHAPNRQNGTMPAVKSYKLMVKFPTTPKPNFTVLPADNNLRKLIPAKLKDLECLLPTVATQGEGVVNNDKCIKGDITLMGIIRRLEFHFIVASPDLTLFSQLDAGIPAPFRYPYGEEHHWSEDRYDLMLPKTKSRQFKPAWSFDNDNEHLAALTQSQVQDVMWIHKASQKIAETKFRAYFVNPLDSAHFYVIVPLGRESLLQHKDAWRILTKSGFLKLGLFDNEEGKGLAKWDARIQEAPKSLDIMRRHPVDNDLVLRVRRPKSQEDRPDFDVKVFEDRTAVNLALYKRKDSWTCVSLEFNDDLLEDCKRKVDAVNLFHPHALPSNPIACGIDRATIDAGHMLSPPGNLGTKMALHRDLLRGKGFCSTLHRLPIINLVLSPEHVIALFQEVPRNDRYRLIEYLRKRHLGLGVITGGPGFGKTTALAVATLAMTATLGKVYAMAPSDVATDIFAERLNHISYKVTDRLKKDKSADDITRARRALILLGYRPDEEYDAFVNTLRDHRLCDKAGPNNDWRVDSKWKLHLSPSFWLLIVLRSPAVPKLSKGDPLVIHEMQADMDSLSQYSRFRSVATGAITCQVYENGKMVHRDLVFEMFDQILFSAVIVCTTPAVSCQNLFPTWKAELAKGIAVDEAGSLSRPDLYSVWGNTLLPCLLCGDDQQLRPAVVTPDTYKDNKENSLNRLGLEAKISALEFFKAMGWPVYRLHTQLRMANSLFDTCHREVYRDLPFTYGPARAGALQEIFIHCPDTICVVDEATKSRRNQEQVHRALGFLSDLVKNTGIPASNIAVISHYKANVELFERSRKGSKHSALLLNMPTAATVDSFQGREADIVVVILGTTKESGPDYATDSHLLNMMLSSHKSGLLIFGDIDVSGRVDEIAKGKGKQRKTITIGGVEHHVKPRMLDNVLRGWYESGRVGVLWPR
ncbi:P-loop containing nucleoside triphosphate hydrolase protein [Trichoderma evansii]